MGEPKPATSAESTYPLVPPNVEKMKVGLNYPTYYDKFGAHLGEAAMPADFERFVVESIKYKVKIFRVMLVCDLFFYGSAVWYPSKVIFFPDDKNVPKLVSGLKSILDTLKKYSCQAVLVLVDFYAFNVEPLKSAGKYEIVQSQHLTDVFFRDVLEPMLKISEPYRDQIYAWEVMNEPLWVDSDRPFYSLPISDYRSPLKRAEVIAFLTAGLKVIEKYAFPSTVGHAMSNDLKVYPTGTLRQYHYYAKNQILTVSDATTLDPLPPHSDTKAFIGEASSHEAVANTSWYGKIQPEGDQRGWPELAGKDLGNATNAVFERLKRGHQQGYPLMILWPWEPGGCKNPDGANKFSQAAKDGIAKYNAWTPKPPTP